MKKYISDGTWFDKGTEAKIIGEPYGDEHMVSGLFEGIRNGDIDQEVCLLEEFEIIEDDNAN